MHTLKSKRNFAGHKPDATKSAAPETTFMGFFHFPFPVRSLAAAGPVSLFLPRTAPFGLRLYVGNTCTHNNVNVMKIRNAREIAHTRDCTYTRVNTLARVHTHKRVPSVLAVLSSTASSAPWLSHRRLMEQTRYHRLRRRPTNPTFLLYIVFFARVILN